MLGMLDWMEWTAPTVTLFIAVMAMLTGLTLWDIRSPSEARKGFMPIALTRGDRFFLSIMTLVGTHIVWLAFLPDLEWRFALPVAGILILILVRWG